MAVTDFSLPVLALASQHDCVAPLRPARKLGVLTSLKKVGRDGNHGPLDLRKKRQT
jgi:hypothetical protein